MCEKKSANGKNNHVIEFHGTGHIPLVGEPYLLAVAEPLLDIAYIGEGHVFWLGTDDRLPVQSIRFNCSTSATLGISVCER